MKNKFKESWLKNITTSKNRIYDFDTISGKKL